MKAGNVKSTIKKVCPSCGKEFVLDPNKALKEQNVCKECK